MSLSKLHSTVVMQTQFIIAYIPTLQLRERHTQTKIQRERERERERVRC